MQLIAGEWDGVQRELRAVFFFTRRRRHTRCSGDWSSDVCSSDLNAGAELVIVGHDHDYERFAPQATNGVADTAFGIGEIVAGRGGGGLFSAPPPVPNSEVLNDNTIGVLKLTLHTSGYTWKFLPIPGQTFTDYGGGSCHGAPSGVNHPPTAAPGGPYTSTEGVAVTFDGRGSFDPDGDALAHAWTFGA